MKGFKALVACVMELPNHRALVANVSSTYNSFSTIDHNPGGLMYAPNGAGNHASGLHTAIAGQIRARSWMPRLLFA